MTTITLSPTAWPTTPSVSKRQKSSTILGCENSRLTLWLSVSFVCSPCRSRLPRYPRPRLPAKRLHFWGSLPAFSPNLAASLNLLACLNLASRRCLNLAASPNPAACKCRNLASPASPNPLAASPRATICFRTCLPRRRLLQVCLRPTRANRLPNLPQIPCLTRARARTRARSNSDLLCLPVRAPTTTIST